MSLKIIIIAVLILFSIYRRVSKSIGWQQISQGKMMFRTTLSLIVGLIFLVEGATHPISLISDVVGITIGVILAYYSSAMTHFEQRDGRWYYRPNKWFGITVIAIFIGRLLYRISEIYMQGAFHSVSGGTAGSFQNFSIGNSWTAGLMLIMFAYYIVYYVILIRKRKQLQSDLKFSDQ
jgi:hypothetical protein